MLTGVKKAGGTLLHSGCSRHAGPFRVLQSRPRAGHQVNEASGSAARRAWTGAARAPCMLALVLGVTACAQHEIRRIPRQHPTFSGATPVARSQREAEMNREWQNRPLAELIAARGRPGMIMNIPGGGMPPSFAVVYGADPGSGCIDAFAISSIGDPVVRIYHCR
jgi:hypothetical protein